MAHAVGGTSGNFLNPPAATKVWFGPHGRYGGGGTKGGGGVVTDTLL